MINILYAEANDKILWNVRSDFCIVNIFVSVPQKILGIAYPDPLNDPRVIRFEIKAGTFVTSKMNNPIMLSINFSQFLNTFHTPSLILLMDQTSLYSYCNNPELKTKKVYR